MPWAFPRNFRAPPLQTSRRQRLLSFLRGASPQRSSSAPAAGSSSTARMSAPGQQLLRGTAILGGGAAAGGTNGMVFSQLSADPEAAPAAHVLASPMQQLLLPPHESSSAPLPGVPAQRYPATANGTTGSNGSGWSENTAASQRLDSSAARLQPQRPLQQLQPTVWRVSPGPPAAEHGTVAVPPPPDGLLASSQGDGGGHSSGVNNTLVSSRGRGTGSAAGAQAADDASAGSLTAGCSDPDLQPPVTTLSDAHSSLSEGASGEQQHSHGSIFIPAGFGDVVAHCVPTTYSSRVIMNRTYHAAGHISIDMLPAEARSMQPAERGPRMSAAVAGAAAALASQPGGDVEQGRRTAGGTAACTTGSRRRGLRAWVTGKNCKC